MTPGEAIFVEEMGQFLGSSGMTPMAGRMWAWLLICDPPEQTASDLATELHASRGAISGTARLLESAGMIRRGRRRGDRHEYFLAPAGALEALLAGRRIDVRPVPRDHRGRPCGPCRSAAGRERATPRGPRRLHLLRAGVSRADRPLPARTRADEPVETLRPPRPPPHRTFPPDVGGSSREDHMTAIIETEKLTKTYGEHRGIVDVDLVIETGEVFGFLGPNGAGKTTTIRVLLDLIRPTSGRAHDLRDRHARRPDRDPSSARLRPRRIRALRPADRRPDARVLRATCAAASTRPTGRA